MLIGIVSKDEHIKVHAQALRKDGYDVVGLGSSPTEIPPTVDMIILRTQSCSHGGSDTAFSWSRSTRKPLIVENGLSGIRSKLRIYALSKNAQTEEQSPMLVESTTPTNTEISFPENTTSPVSESLAEKNYIFFFPQGSESMHWNTAVPTHRAKNAFQESLEILKEMPKDLRNQIVDTYTKAVAKGKGPYFLKISSYYSRPEYKVVEKLKGRPLHFFLLMQWLLLDKVTPTVKDQQTAYFDFCGSKSMKAYVEAAAWIVQNGKKTEAEANAGLDRVFDELIEPEVTASVPVRDTPTPTPVLDISGIRRDLEDFVLEVAGTNSEVLSLVKTLRSEVSSLKEELKSLRDEVLTLRAGGSFASDSMKALEDLRDRGAVVTVTFGTK